MNAIALKTDFNNLPDNIIVLNKQESKLKETETKLKKTVRLKLCCQLSVRRKGKLDYFHAGRQERYFIYSSSSETIPLLMTSYSICVAHIELCVSPPFGHK